MRTGGQPEVVSTHRNSHSDEPDERQQSQFSWVESTAEEPGVGPEPKGRSPLPRPSRVGIYSGAGGKEPVGTGRHPRGYSRLPAVNNVPGNYS